MLRRWEFDETLDEGTRVWSSVSSSAGEEGRRRARSASDEEREDEGCREEEEGPEEVEGESASVGSSSMQAFTVKSTARR